MVQAGHGSKKIQKQDKNEDNLQITQPSGIPWKPTQSGSAHGQSEAYDIS